MALQVWLPLNGMLENKGLAKIKMTSTNAVTYVNGKIGQAIKFSNSTATSIYDSSVCQDLKYTDNFSYCMWIKNISKGSGNASYLFTVGRADAGSYGYGILINSATQIVFRFGTHSATKNIVDGEWNFIAFTKSGTTLTYYINGVVSTATFSGTLPSYISSEYGGLGIGCFHYSSGNIYPCNATMNDFRISDHCLSPKEVKELSKGLVLHYKLDDQYSESTTNIVRYPIQGSSVGSIGWDVSKHQNAIYVSNWGVGYNSGVSTPAQGYHACWKIIDGLPTMVMVDRNSEIGLPHRLIGISGGISGIMIPSNTIYTVSFDAMSDVQNKQMSSGVYYRQSSSGSYGFHDGCPVFTLSTNWKRYSYTYTIKTVNNILSLYFYGHNGSLEGTVYIRNIQVELKNYATPYVNGTRTATTMYDSSGYGNNGNIIGNLNISNDTLRYNYSSLFSATVTNYITVPYQGLQGSYNNKVWTISFWINTQQQGNRHMIVGMVGNYNTNIELSTSNTLRIYWAGTPDWTPSISCPINTWVHIVVVITSTYIKAYKDGVLIGTNNTAPNWAGCTSNLLIGSDQRIGTFFLGAKLSDFRLYSTELSLDDIKELYNNAAYISDSKSIGCYILEENNSNIISLENYGIETKLWLGGLSNYTQANCQCTLTDDGYRIYRTPNITYDGSNSSRTMWGGFVLDNTDNRFGFVQGHTYMIQFEVKGKSSNAASDTQWNNLVGWNGGGLQANPSNIMFVNPVTNNFNSTEWKTVIYKWTISDTVYKVCTSSYLSFVAGNTYLSYKGFKFGYSYISTGSLGTDIYIRNIRMYNITDNTPIQICNSGTINTSEIVELNEMKFILGDVILTNQLIEI